jgi:hypothetical protein
MKFLLALCLVLAAMIVLRDSPTSREIDRILDRLHGDRIVKARGGITAVGDLRNYVTSNPIVYEVMHTTKTIVVPKGFVTDLASIPRLFRILLPRDDVYMLPAVIHDYLYWTQGCSRSEADSVLFLAMKEYEIDPFRRWIIYLGVRWFGAWAWRANSRLKDGGEKRFVSGEFVDRLQNSPISAKETLEMVLEKARLENGLVLDEKPNLNVKDACLAATQF